MSARINSLPALDLRRVAGVIGKVLQTAEVKVFHRVVACRRSNWKSLPRTEIIGFHWFTASGTIGIRHWAVGGGSTREAVANALDIRLNPAALGRETF
jgi:hypothetical protein